LIFDTTPCRIVAVAVNEAPTPNAGLHTIEVDDAHSEDVVLLPRKDVGVLESMDLSPEPSTVTLAAPVAAAFPGREPTMIVGRLNE
jgi:hypothetical protein